jgi:anti-sigma-K factor RskA
VIVPIVTELKDLYVRTGQLAQINLRGKMANMTNASGHKTEEDIAPNFWKWMIIALCALVVLALISAGVFYYARGRKENRQPPGVPQTFLFPPRGKPAVGTSLGITDS